MISWQQTTSAPCSAAWRRSASCTSIISPLMSSIGRLASPSGMPAWTSAALTVLAMSDRSSLAQGIDGPGIITDLGKDFRRVLTEGRRAPADAPRGGRKLDRHTEELERTGAVGLDLDDHLPVPRFWRLQGLCDRADSSARNSRSV